MKKLKVSIIVLNYNGVDFLKKCLPTIKKQTYSNIETIVVDNNSDDGSCEYVKKRSWVKLVENDKNYGYTGANNIAAKKASGEFLLFLNNDTELFPDMIETLVANYKNKTITAPAQILSVNKKTDLTGMAGVGMDIFGYPYVNVDPKKTKTFFADGAAIFVKKKDFFEIGMFDDELFIFQEDIDFSWRAQLFGYKIVPCWDAKFYHYSGGVVLGGGFKNKQYETSYFRRYLNEKNIVRNILKNYSAIFCLLILPLICLIHFAEVILLVLMLHWKVASCYIKAYWWNLINLGNTLKYRKKIQRKRKVSDYKLMNKMYFAYSKLTSLKRVGFPKFK